MILTPTELHYFKRELVTRQVDKELAQLRQKPDLAGLMAHRLSCDHYPFLSYLFQHFVIEFPLLKSKNQDEFWSKCQAILGKLSAVTFHTFAPDADAGGRRTVNRFKKAIIIALCASIKSIQGREETIRLTNEITLSAEAYNMSHHEDHGLDIVAVRERKHAEFVVRSGREGHSDEPILFVGRRHGRFRHLRDELRSVFPNEPLPEVPPKTYDPHRETDRLQLRSFLRYIADNPKFMASSVLIDFLTKDPIKLNKHELADMRHRAQLDKERAEERQRKEQEVNDKAVEINKLLDTLKEEIKKPEGLQKLFDIIKATESAQQLPQPLQKAFEWGRLSFAFALHKRFIVSDMAPENIANLKRTHSLMPYRTIAAYLNLASPMAMVKGVMNLFLARPLGTPSLLQRIILANLNEESKGFQKQIEALKQKINDDMLCEKIANAVHTPLTEDMVFEESSALQQTLSILQNEDIQPRLTPEQIIKVVYWKHDKQAQQLLDQLHQLWSWYARQREQEILTNLVFRGVAGDLLKELFTLLYEPLAQVYRAARIGDSVRDVSSFIDELISLLETSDGSLQPFITLTQRYEQKFYYFVHSVYSRDQSHLFDKLISYVDRIFQFMAHGMPGLVDIDLVVNTALPNKTEQEALKEEISLLCHYRYQQKTQYLERTRHKVRASMPEYDLFQLLPKTTETKGVLMDLEDMDYEDISSDDKEKDEEEEEEDTTDDGNDAFSIRTGMSNTSQTTVHTSDESSKSAHTLLTEPPSLVITPRVVPYFVSDVTKIMRMS
ncbi:hypothetical protein DFQ28_010421 [Apophysomyces sp. BC1034]|nr:hypothetical protein DFQ30_010044 [Apophysomyces sp. BC1015]KAG0171540.1 hypothetical protein DFQ29_008784 [Apophysomyces sp. BC1021]KAG0184822.1 hypothetical protein DFQ28_010421 [Apophysomyces sp. BC1034]